jgi:hypothetical protein
MNPVEKMLKKNKICPVCTAKKIMNGTRLNLKEPAFENGAAPTPPMGWASWNLWGRRVTEDVIVETARAMQALHLDELGYTYVNVDDCWMSSVRDASGRLQGDLSTFPSGIRALAEKVNACGFKLGLYTSNGTYTCEDLPSSLYHEETDAETFAEWGVEYFKYDFCHNVPIPTAAPEIRALSLAAPGGAEFAVYRACEAELRGAAAVFEDRNLSGKGEYVGGLDAAAGSVVFIVSAPEAGSYTLTLEIRKHGNYEKYAEVEINGAQTHMLRVPASRGAGHDGRVQFTAVLGAGANTVLVHNPVASRMDSAAKQYRRMGLLLKEAAERRAAAEGREVRPICFSICEWGLNRPWKWGASAGNLWRTTPDIRPTWASVLGIYEWNVRLYEYASPGHFNDPDMLEVGNGSLTLEENRTHFSLWCMMAAPLILGNDLRAFLLPDGRVDRMNETLQIITNRMAISIDQDPLGRQCKRVRTDLITDVLAKPLSNRELAVCILNKSGRPRKAEALLGEIVRDPYIETPDARRYQVTDVWNNTTFVTQNAVGGEVPAHGVLLYKVKAMS